MMYRRVFFGVGLVAALLGADVAAADDRVVFVSDVYADRIVRIDSVGEATVVADAADGDPLALPLGIAFDDATGSLYVANHGDSTIARFDFASADDTDPTPTVFATAAEGLVLPQQLIFGPDGMLYASSRGVAQELGHVQRFDPESGAQQILYSTLNPFGLAFDSDGSLLVADLQLDTVTRLQFDGSGQVSSATPVADASDGVEGPSGLAIDDHGAVYVANSFGDDNIIRIDPAGGGSVFATPPTVDGSTLAAVGDMHFRDDGTLLVGYAGTTTAPAQPSRAGVVSFDADGSVHAVALPGAGSLLVSPAGLSLQPRSSGGLIAFLWHLFFWWL